MRKRFRELRYCFTDADLEKRAASLHDVF